MHGTDHFQYQLTDCLGYGESSTITVALPPPGGPFKDAFFLGLQAWLGDGSAVVGGVQGSDPNASSTQLEVNLGVPVLTGTFSLYQLLKSVAPVSLKLKGLRGSLTAITLPNGAILDPSRPNASLSEKEWTQSQTWVAFGGTGEAEIWISGSADELTYRVQVEARTACAHCYLHSLLPPPASTMLTHTCTHSYRMWSVQVEVLAPTSPAMCGPGSVLLYLDSGPRCNLCQPGQFESENLYCREVDSFHYIPAAGQSEAGKISCSAKGTKDQLRNANLLTTSCLLGTRY